MDLSLDQLRAFIAVVDEQGFTAAGRKLGRVQSAVSQAIAAMEDQLGFPLFRSPRRQALLTAEGEALVPRARELLAGYDGLVGQARRLAGGTESELSIVFEALYPKSSVADACSRVADAYPDCRQRLGFESLGDVVTAVVEGRYDMGVVGPGLGDEPELTRAHLGTLKLIPVAAPGHALTAVEGTIARDLVRPHRQIVFDSRPGENAADAGVLSIRQWRVADIEAKRELIRRGLGWGNLPEPMIRTDLEAGRLVPLSIEGWGPNEHHLSVAMIRRRDVTPGPVALVAIEALHTACE